MAVEVMFKCVHGHIFDVAQLLGHGVEKLRPSNAKAGFPDVFQFCGALVVYTWYVAIPAASVTIVRCNFINLQIWSQIFEDLPDVTNGVTLTSPLYGVKSERFKSVPVVELTGFMDTTGEGTLYGL